MAVSKFKSAQDIVEAYEAGQRHFGENYVYLFVFFFYFFISTSHLTQILITKVKELEAKSNSAEIVANCANIKWHFIGKLQSSKVNNLTCEKVTFNIQTYRVFFLPGSNLSLTKSNCLFMGNKIALKAKKACFF